MITIEKKENSIQGYLEKKLEETWRVESNRRKYLEGKENIIKIRRRENLPKHDSKLI
jgi:hypothetical protein